MVSVALPLLRGKGGGATVIGLKTCLTFIGQAIKFGWGARAMAVASHALLDLRYRKAGRVATVAMVFKDIKTKQGLLWFLRI